MIEQVTMYRTPDNKVFDTEEKALDHICDKCQEYVAGLLKHRLPNNGRFTANDIHVITTSLIRSGFEAKELSNTLGLLTGDL